MFVHGVLFLFSSKATRLSRPFTPLELKSGHMLRLDVPLKSPFLVLFKNGLNAVEWCCVHDMSKRSRVPLMKRSH